MRFHVCALARRRLRIHSCPQEQSLGSSAIVKISKEIRAGPGRGSGASSGAGSGASSGRSSGAGAEPALEPGRVFRSKQVLDQGQVRAAGSRAGSGAGSRAGSVEQVAEHVPEQVANQVSGACSGGSSGNRFWGGSRGGFGVSRAGCGGRSSGSVSGMECSPCLYLRCSHGNARRGGALV